MLVFISFADLVRQGNLLTEFPIDLPDPIMMHDFAITEHYRCDCYLLLMMIYLLFICYLLFLCCYLLLGFIFVIHSLILQYYHGFAACFQPKEHSMLICFNSVIPLVYIFIYIYIYITTFTSHFFFLYVLRKTLSCSINFLSSSHSLS
jgi:hypothetical protein